MPIKLSEIYQAVENIRGKKLVVALLLILVVFVLIGIIIGNVIPKKLNSDENLSTNPSQNVPVTEDKHFEGKVSYVDPQYYPLDEISYYLEDSSGKTIILLSAEDEKLAVVEGLNVIVYGIIEKTKDNTEDVLVVDRIIVKNR